MSDDKILDRVRKLLRLATSDNVHEAANAAAQAQALIDRHRLEAWAEHERKGDPLAESAAIVEAIDSPLDESKRLRKWKIFLAANLAPIHDCRIYVLEPTPPSKLRRLVPVGRAEDIELFREMFGFLVTRIECLTRNHGQAHDRKWCDGFRVGAAKTIVSRLSAERRHLLASHEPTETSDFLSTMATSEANPSALVPAGPRAFAVRLAQVDEYLRRKTALRPGRALRVDSRGFAHGELVAHDVELPSR